jgi:HK97 family phage major capsid protein
LEITNMRTAAQIADRMQLVAAQIGALSDIEARPPAQQAELESLEQEFQQLDKEYPRARARDRVAELSAGMPRMVVPLDPAGGTSWTGAPAPGRATVTGGELVAHGYGNHGFQRGPGEFFAAIVNAAYGRVHPSLKPFSAVTTFGSEGVGADGGYAVPPDFARGILRAVTGGTSFVGALNVRYTTSNMLEMPTDETTPWQTDEGITAERTEEGAAITASKVKFGQNKIPLYAAKALVHVTEENLQDVPFLGAYVIEKMGEKIRYIVEDWAMNGSGVAAVLGFLGADSLITTAKESTQTRATTPLVPKNVFKMAGSLVGDGFSRAFWAINPTVLPEIWDLTSGTTSPTPLYVSDMSKAPGGLLLGRPIFLSEACAAVGTAGDIVLVDPAGYTFVTKAEGLSTATTIAFAFDQGLQSFRATMRVGGAPVLSAPVIRAKGSNVEAGNIVNLGV